MTQRDQRRRCLLPQAPAGGPSLADARRPLPHAGVAGYAPCILTLRRACWDAHPPAAKGGAYAFSCGPPYLYMLPRRSKPGASLDAGSADDMPALLPQAPTRRHLAPAPLHAGRPVFLPAYGGGLRPRPFHVGAEGPRWREPGEPERMKYIY
jgi:hypothetical protein